MFIFWKFFWVVFFERFWVIETLVQRAGLEQHPQFLGIPQTTWGKHMFIAR